MTGNAPGSPTRKGTQDVAQRIERLLVFEAQSRSEPSSTAILRETAGADVWDDYWTKLEQIREKLLEAEQAAAIIRSRLDAAFLAAGVQNSE